MTDTPFAPGELRMPLGTDDEAWEYVKPHTSQKGKSWWKRCGQVKPNTALMHAMPDWIVLRYWRKLL